MPNVRDMIDPSFPELAAFPEGKQVELSALAEDLCDILTIAERTMASKVVGMEMDEHLALWSLLPAKVRTAIKRGGQ